MKILYYLTCFPTGLMALIFLFKTLSGTSRGFSSTSEKVVTVIASLIVLGLLYWSFQLATTRASPGLATGVVVLSWIVFVVMMLISGLNNTKTWN